MAYDRFLIAPFSSGLQTDLRPWLIPEDAFASLRNAYVFRGRVRKRFGSTLTGNGTPGSVTAPLFSRLRIPLAGGAGVGTTDAMGAATGTVPGSIFKVGQMFSIDDQLFTVAATGTPTTLLSTDASVTTHTFNTTTGVYTFDGATPNTQIYFYPAEPVMGLTNYESGTVNNQPSYAFDTQFAYTYSGGSWIRSGTGSIPLWHGDNLDFYWSYNYEGVADNTVALFVTNFQATVGTGAVTDDPIWSFNGSSWSPFSYSPDATINPTNQQPYTVTTTTGASGSIIANYVQSARIVVSFKNRLLLLNTIENNANGATAFDPLNPTTTGITPANYLTSTSKAYPQRVRYSHVGSPFSDNAWLEPNQVYTNGTNPQVVADGAGFEDATTEEEIIGAEFIKDRLIVFFERSTWELAYTGNEVRPFVWQKINTELGSEATFSTVPFDKVVLAIGNTGVHACNGSNVERIDNKIPDLIFQIVDKNLGVQRVAGIRDYYTELVYWTFPSIEQNPNEVYPTKVLVYNYKTGSWALNDDCITCFGYFEQQEDTTWATAQGTWQQANYSWTSGVVQAQFRQVIAGNQQGYIFYIDPDDNSNATVMTITNMANSGNNLLLTIVDHTLDVGEYIAIENAQGVTGVNSNIYTVLQFVSTNQVLVGNPSQTTNITGTYTGGGVVRRVSNIQILSKQWNPYVQEGRNVYVAKIDFGVMKTSAGQVTVDYYPSATELSMLTAGTATNMIMGTGVLETSPYADVPLETEQNRLWHPVYLQSDGECIQILISMSPTQIINPQIAYSPFELEGLVLHTMRTSSRLQ